MYTLELVNISLIVETEEHIEERAIWLKSHIEEEGIWRVPIILERKTLAVMDGHHRLSAAKALGLQRIPAILLDYQSDNVVVSSWRADFHIDKTVIRYYIDNGLKFPHKTTRHIISPNPLEVAIPISFLN